jgi:hypothetical protein
LFGLKALHVSSSIENTAALGAADQTAALQGTGKFLIYYRGTSNAISEPCAVKMINCDYGFEGTGTHTRVSSYREEKIRADVFRVDQDFTFKVISQDLGILLKDCLSA